MFGESFLAAPVVRQGAVEWDVYLPTHGSGLGPAWLDVGSTMQVCFCVCKIVVQVQTILCVLLNIL